MLLSALFSGSILEIIVTVVAALFLVFICIPAHELAHGYMAYKLGDKSVKATGQLSLNPLAHIDPLGGAMIALVGFGWGKPCHVNSRYFKNEKRDLALTAAAGPISNLLLGWLFIFIYVALYYLAPNFMGSVLGNNIIGTFLYICFEISIWLGVLNLLPIPMFDGFTILEAFLPDDWIWKIRANMQTISIVLIILIFAGVLTTPIEWISTFIMKFFMWISSLPFELILGA